MNPLFSSTRDHSNTGSSEISTSENYIKSRWNVPKMHFSDSSATEDQQGAENSSSDESSIGFNISCIYSFKLDRFPQINNSAIGAKIQTKDSPVLFALRVLSVYSPCFFCNAKLRLHNLWTLYKHLKFVHPRFTFTYEVFCSLIFSNEYF